MSNPNGLMEDAKSLTPEQLKQLQQLVNPYLGQVQQLETQANGLRQVMSDIAAAYLMGIGLDSGLTIELSTGKVSRPLVETTGEV